MTGHGLVGWLDGHLEGLHGVVHGPEGVPDDAHAVTVIAIVTVGVGVEAGAKPESGAVVLSTASFLVVVVVPVVGGEGQVVAVPQAVH